jgi:hypothetical protein
LVDYLVNCLSGCNRRERRKGEEREERKGKGREEKRREEKKEKRREEREEKRREEGRRRNERGGRRPDAAMCCLWHITLLCAELFVSTYRRY